VCKGSQGLHWANAKEKKRLLHLCSSGVSEGRVCAITALPNVTPKAGVGIRAEGGAAEGEGMPRMGKGWLGVRIKGKVEADLCQLAAILLWKLEVLAR